RLVLQQARQASSYRGGKPRSVLGMRAAQGPAKLQNHSTLKEEVMSWGSGVVAAGVGLAVLSVLGVSSEAHGAPPERSRAQQGTLVVDLNQATPQDLMQLPGIGRSR